MAHVERRYRKAADGTIMRANRVRWREPDGRERNKTFQRNVEADRFWAVIAADLVKGQYVDPDAGKIPFETYAKKWIDAQTFEETTREAVRLRMRPHAYPHIGDRYLSDVLPSPIQSWLRALGDLAPAYRKVVFANVATIFNKLRSMTS